MRRLVWAFAGGTHNFVGNLMSRLICYIRRVTIFSCQQRICDLLIIFAYCLDPDLDPNCSTIWKYSWENSLKKVSWQQKRRPKIGFQDWLSLNAGQKFCRMLQGGEHSAILLTFIISSHLSLRSLFRLFLSGGLRQVLLFWQPKCSFCFVDFFLLKWDFFTIKKDTSTRPTALESDGQYFEIMGQWPWPTINLKAWRRGAQWLSCGVLDLRWKGHWVEPHQSHCVVSKTQHLHCT